MNGKKYNKTFIKILGMFQMEAENFSPAETRKTLVCATLCLTALIAVWKTFAVVELLLK